MPTEINPWYHQPENKPISSGQIQRIAQLPQKEFGSIKVTNPSDLLRTVREISTLNSLSPWEVTKQLRLLSAQNPEEVAAIEKKYSKERIAYVSDIHGAENDDAFFGSLDQLLDQKPEFLFLVGDVIGNKSIDTLQKYFYNWLNNHSKNEILKENPTVDDTTLLAYPGKNPPEVGFTLKTGFIKVRQMELELQGFDKEIIDQTIRDLTDEQIATEIRRYAKYIHYGHYASNLPTKAKETLAKGFETNVQRVVTYLKKFQEIGTKVIVLEGNWDARSPIDFVPGTDSVTPIPPEQRIFNLGNHLQKNGIDFCNQLTIVETESTLHLLAPFDAITNAPDMDQTQVDHVKQKIDSARKKGKAIIMFSHGQPNFQIQNLSAPNPIPTGENAQIIRGMTDLVSKFSPDEIIHGHIHNPIKDKHGEVKSNAKYLLKLSSEGKLDMASQTESGQVILVSYLELKRMAIAEIYKKGNKKPAGLGGHRQPAQVI